MILSGDGGGGKTTIALQLAVAVERGLGEWLGTTTSSGPVIFVSAEEPEAEMRRRLDRVARKLGIDPAEITGLHFHFAEPEASLLAVASGDGTMSPTPLFQALAAAAEIIRPAILMIDSVAAVFGGNQNDRVQVRSFVSLLRGIARRAGCAVLLLDHPSLTGITAGTGRGGSMDWQNSVRARLHLRSIKDDDAERELEVMKINYAAPGGENAIAMGGRLFRARVSRSHASNGRGPAKRREGLPRVPRRVHGARAQRLPCTGTQLCADRVRRNGGSEEAQPQSLGGRPATAVQGQRH